MPFRSMELSGLLVYEPRVFEDARGYFFESYNETIFTEAGLTQKWIQDNQSSSKYGVIRGLHYQLEPFAQAKLVRVLAGKILDVAVDIRKGSPTYGKHVAIELSAENKLQLLVPRGFAHGFSVLSEQAEVLYKCDNVYSKESEGSIIFNDPALNIDWKVPANAVVLSEKDRQHPVLAECRNNFQFETTPA